MQYSSRYSRRSRPHFSSFNRCTRYTNNHSGRDIIYNGRYYEDYAHEDIDRYSLRRYSSICGHRSSLSRQHFPHRHGQHHTEIRAYPTNTLRNSKYNYTRDRYNRLSYSSSNSHSVYTSVHKTSNSFLYGGKSASVSVISPHRAHPSSISGYTSVHRPHSDNSALTIPSPTLSVSSSPSKCSTKRADTQTSHLCESWLLSNCLGFPNYGNSCYQNATLQVLLSLLPFMLDVVKKAHISYKSLSHSLSHSNQLVQSNSPAYHNSENNFHADMSNMFSDTIISSNDICDVSTENNSCDIPSVIPLPPPTSHDLPSDTPLLTPPASNTAISIAQAVLLKHLGLKKQLYSHLNRMRSVFSVNIDPIFSGTQQQDANEFLLRLLDTLSCTAQPVPAGVSASTDSVCPVRDNFEYSTCELYVCSACSHTSRRVQTHISMFVNLPPVACGQQLSSCDHSGPAGACSLAAALDASFVPESRQFVCDSCARVSTCSVAPTLVSLPRVLVLQLNRYVFRADYACKLRTTVHAPQCLSLDKYLSVPADSITSPCVWSFDGLSDDVLSLISQYRESECKDGNSNISFEPTEEDNQLQEAIRLSLEQETKQFNETLSLEDTADTRHSHDDSPSSPPAVWSTCSVDGGEQLYHIVAVISHYGASTHSGHYVADVRVGAGTTWQHYDDRDVTSLTQSQVLCSASTQRNGYLFFYLHHSVFSQLNAVVETLASSHSSS